MLAWLMMTIKHLKRDRLYLFWLCRWLGQNVFEDRQQLYSFLVHYELERYIAANNCVVSYWTWNDEAVKESKWFHDLLDCLEFNAQVLEFQKCIMTAKVECIWSRTSFIMNEPSRLMLQCTLLKKVLSMSKFQYRK